MTRRFFVEPGSLVGDHPEIVGALPHRLATVLRMRAGDEVTLFDGGGEDVRVRFEEVTDRRISAAVVGRASGPAEPRTKLHLFQSVTKGERFEWLLEKVTEIGVASVTPLLTGRSVVKPASGGNRAERWLRIVVEAAEQCERSAVPAVHEPAAFNAALQRATGVLLLPYEGASHAAPTVADVLNRRVDEVFALAEVSIFIGPEGGYEPQEVDIASAAGAEIVTLGDRVLRSETAGLVAATLAMHALGELG